MKAAYSETKSESFHSFKIPELKGMEQRVVDVFNHDRRLTYTFKHIAQRANMVESSVCGRVNSLIAKGVLVDRGRFYDSDTNRTIRLVGLPVPVQLDLLAAL